ncbi:hypothetical protein AJ79_01808 [Helicocarpus griseus UAMH5409]|uniref:Tyrosinase copper-binding domain-containing protein n=1 Tax=Helicocarpus griseus UAMH5409 TaxID=1447875 RepID=A0A2B7Y571_9EURO|nr:hypothetical protein AJ79_01808 [Helicocarpus griseus UAMH5409]
MEYIDAELCLMRLPAKTGHKGTVTRFDDFQAVHVQGAYLNHLVGSFLPFHRLLVHNHETALREECGYKGYQPYWYEQKDAGKFSSSEIFDPVYGFGGNGVGNGNCITDGPFAKYTNRLGPGYEVTNHCMNRKINDETSSGASPNNVNKCMSQPDWLSAWNCIEGAPHVGGHDGVGGQMSDGVASPGDPLFYLHHAWIDKLWWDWQAKNLPARLTEMGGSNLPPSAPPEDVQNKKIPGDPGRTTTLNHVLDMHGTMDNKIIADVMNIKGDFLCFEYVEPA